MRQVNTPDGVAYISTPSDYGDICRKYISDDFAKIVEENLNKVEDNTAYAEAKAKTDLDAAEGEVEFYRDMLFEIKEVIEQLLYKAEKHPKLRKATILRDMERIDNRITENL